ncbi:GLE1-like protein-domain-containing protein [Lipomyces japonicus]|uniref:GLE1-like protein-domain-containing protein n=1 Tax=Lipomyces japonicus TaxID=56871 RepID=UPI0034CF67C9
MAVYSLDIDSDSSEDEFVADKRDAGKTLTPNNQKIHNNDDTTLDDIGLPDAMQYLSISVNVEPTYISPNHGRRSLSRAQMSNNLNTVYSLLEKGTEQSLQQAKKMLKSQNEYFKYQNNINKLKYKQEGENKVNGYFSKKKSETWASINAAIDLERKKAEEAIKKANEEVERKAKQEAQRKAKDEAERKAKEEHERKVKEEAERKAKQEGERKAKQEAEQKADQEAEQKAKQKAREETERKAKEAAIREEKEQAEWKLKEEEQKAKEEQEIQSKKNEKSKEKVTRVDENKPQVNQNRLQDALDSQKIETSRLSITEEPGTVSQPSEIIERILPQEKSAVLAIATKRPQTPTLTEAQREANYYWQVIERIKKDINEPVAENKQLKSYCSANKRKIKPKLGQLTNSKSQIAKILGELKMILDEARNTSELGYKWLLNFLSKAIVSQAETETIVQPMTAFPLGSLAIYMMTQHDMLRDLLIARFVKKCPYVIGYTCSIDTEEGRKRMGYKRIEEKWEDDAMYSERMGGIGSVWAVLTQMSNEAPNAKFPYPLYESWTYVSRSLNLRPEELTNAHYTVMGAWLEMAGRRFLETYSVQAVKLLKLIVHAWPEQRVNDHFPGALRLTILGEQWQREGTIGIQRPLEA